MLLRKVPCGNKYVRIVLYSTTVQQYVRDMYEVPRIRRSSTGTVHSPTGFSSLLTCHFNNFPQIRGETRTVMGYQVSGALWPSLLTVTAILARGNKELGWPISNDLPSLLPENIVAPFLGLSRAIPGMSTVLLTVCTVMHPLLFSPSATPLVSITVQYGVRRTVVQYYT